MDSHLQVPLLLAVGLRIILSNITLPAVFGQPWEHRSPKYWQKTCKMSNIWFWTAPQRDGYPQVRHYMGLLSCISPTMDLRTA